VPVALVGGVPSPSCRTSRARAESAPPSRVSAGEWVLHGARGAGTTVHLLGSHDRRSWARAPGACGPRVLPHRVYFLSVAFFSAGALDGDFAIDVVGTMMWAYGVPFHITHGPPLVQSVGYASS
jgi:hypothetical protein